MLMEPSSEDVSSDFFTSNVEILNLSLIRVKRNELNCFVERFLK